MLVRHADDFVALYRSPGQADEVLRRVRERLGGIGLELHPDETRVIELGPGKARFAFSGCYPRVVQSHFEGHPYLLRWPSLRAMNGIRERIRELTGRRRREGTKQTREVTRDLSLVLRGWGNYFRMRNASIKSQQVDRYVNSRIASLMYRGRRDRHRPFHSRRWTPALVRAEPGLQRLVGTIRYAGSANAA